MSILRTMGRTAVISATATAVSNRVSRKQHGKWAAAAPTQANAAPAPAQPEPTPAPAAVPGDMSEKVALLERLGVLKAQGLLTDQEFQTQKQKILDS